MKSYSFYDAATGIFSANHVTVPVELLAINTPPGFVALEGVHDHLAVQVVAGTVVQRHSPPRDTASSTWQFDEVLMRWVPKPKAALLELQMRTRRDKLLAESDWVVTKAAEAGEAPPAPWVSYRQALRDLPGMPGWPTEVTWPSPPR